MLISREILLRVLRWNDMIWVTTQGEEFTTKTLRHGETQKISDIFMVLEK